MSSYVPEEDDLLSSIKSRVLRRVLYFSTPVAAVVALIFGGFFKHSFDTLAAQFAITTDFPLTLAVTAGAFLLIWVPVSAGLYQLFMRMVERSFLRP